MAGIGARSKNHESGGKPQAARTAIHVRIDCGSGERSIHCARMIRAIQMIFAPEGAWLKIAEKNRHFLFVLFLSTLPLLAGALAAEVYGLMRLGETIGEFGR